MTFTIIFVLLDSNDCCIGGTIICVSARPYHMHILPVIRLYWNQDRRQRQPSTAIAYIEENKLYIMHVYYYSFIRTMKMQKQWYNIIGSYIPVDIEMAGAACVKVFKTPLLPTE